MILHAILHVKQRVISRISFSIFFHQVSVTMTKFLPCPNSKSVDFEYNFPLSRFKKLIVNAKLTSFAQKMSTSKAVPDGLKLIECERDLAGKNSPICYIREKDPIQEALERKPTTSQFKVKLPSTCSELRVAIWASGTPEHFLIHVRGAVHVINQMPGTIEEAMRSVESTKLMVEIAKSEFDTKKNDRRKDKDHEEVIAARAALEGAQKTLTDCKTKVDMAGKRVFELYSNLLSNEACQAWEKLSRLRPRQPHGKT